MTEANEPRTVRLGVDLRIAAAAQAYQSLAAAIEAPGGAVMLDAGGVTKVDAAGLQVLIAARRAAEAAGKSLAWSQCSPQVQDAAALLGLSDALGVPK